jgi:alpha-L-fucosidase
LDFNKYFKHKAMMIRLLNLLLAMIVLSGCGTTGKKGAGEAEKPVYEETWESLARHNEQPDWFQDAKFGIYFHWGVYSVPAYGDEWYPRWMHYEIRDEYRHHVEKYGHPSEFGYHDFVPMFKAENFDAEEWAELFHESRRPLCRTGCRAPRWFLHVAKWRYPLECGQQRAHEGYCGRAGKSN